MYKQTLAALAVLATLTGCSHSQVQNPVDYLTYRSQPLVKQVELGMNEQQVLTIGGEPSSRVLRKAYPGTCNNYVLSKDGKQQVYYVSFNDIGKVDSKGFMTCEQHEKNQRSN